MPPPSYHERQSKMMCAKHAINNLLQEKAYHKEDLHEICYGFSGNHWWNPHENMFGLGNYDVNVLTKALELKGMDLVWFDSRKPVTDIPLDECFGFICNRYQRAFYIFPSRHWYSIRQFDDIFYNCDSKLDRPTPFASREEFLQHIREINENGQLFLVKRSENSNNSNSSNNSASKR